MAAPPIPPAGASVRSATRRPRSQRVVVGKGTLGDLGRATTFAPRDAHMEASGQASQRGARGVQVADARSITASSQRPGWPRATRPSAVAWKPIEVGASPMTRRDDAPNVDVEGRHWHAVRRRGDCAGGVGADARESLQGVDGLGHAAAVVERRSTGRSRAGSAPAGCSRALPKPRAARACSRRRGPRPSANGRRSAAMPDRRDPPRSAGP